MRSTNNDERAVSVIMSGGTPLEQLPEFSGQYDDNYVQDAIDGYQPQGTEFPPPRPQGRQLQGPSIDGPGSPIKRHRQPVIKNIAPFDWKDYTKREMTIPIVAGIIFFVLNMQIVDVQLLKYLPSLFNRDFELNSKGIVFKSAMMAAALFLIKYALSP